jgi:hypothetical protein
VRPGVPNHSQLTCVSLVYLHPSGSVFDLEQVNRTISSVVRIDRLPKNNSMEALLTLQDAWDHVDAYHKHADFYKVLTKLSYGLLLLAGIATSVIAISRGTYTAVFYSDIYLSPDFYRLYRSAVRRVTEKVDAGGSGSSSSNTQSQYAILAISLLVTTVVGYVNFMNPAQRWQQLRGVSATARAAFHRLIRFVICRA